MPIYNFPNTESNDAFEDDNIFNQINAYRNQALLNEDNVLSVDEASTLWHLYFNVLYMATPTTDAPEFPSQTALSDALMTLIKASSKSTHTKIVSILEKIKSSKYYTINFTFQKTTESIVYIYDISSNVKAIQKRASKRIEQFKPIPPEDLTKTIREYYQITGNVKYLPDFAYSLVIWYDPAQKIDKTAQSGFRNDEIANVFLIQRSISDKSGIEQIAEDITGKKVRENNGYTTYITDPKLWNDNFSDPHADKLYRYILREYDKHPAYKVKIDTREFAKTIGAKPIDERKQILSVINKIRTAYFGVVTSTTFGVYQIFTGFEIGKKTDGSKNLNDITIQINPEFKDKYLDKPEYYCSIPECLFKLNNYDTGGNAYFIGVYLVEKHRKEYKKYFDRQDPEQRHTTKQLLKMASKLSSYDTLKKKSQYKQRIVQPFIRALDELISIEFLTEYRFVSPNGDTLQEPLNLSWNEFISSYIVLKGNFPEYPDLHKGLTARREKAKQIQEPEGEIEASN